MSEPSEQLHAIRLNKPRLVEPHSGGEKEARTKLSIVMPAYNEQSTIARAVAEVLRAQLPCEFELIVVNDGSTDGTSEILRALRHHRLG